MLVPYHLTATINSPELARKFDRSVTNVKERRTTTHDTSAFKPSYDIFDNQVVRDATVSND